jgi:hypothetical protein
MLARSRAHSADPKMIRLGFRPERNLLFLRGQETTSTEEEVTEQAEEVEKDKLRRRR